MIRVIFRKGMGLHHQSAQWRRYCQMIVKLLTNTSIFLIVETPSNVMEFR